MQSFKVIIAENPTLVLATAGDYLNSFRGVSPDIGETE